MNAKQTHTHTHTHTHTPSAASVKVRGSVIKVEVWEDASCMAYRKSFNVNSDCALESFKVVKSLRFYAVFL